jgi:hypothetical protein
MSLYGSAFAEDRVVPVCIMEDDLKFEDSCFKILEVPSHIKDALPKIIDRLWNDTLWEEGSDLESDIVPTLQRFRITRKYYLWVYGITVPSANIRRIYLILENSRSKIVMENIHSLDFRWTVSKRGPDWNKEYLQGKLIEIKDVDNDHKNEIIIQQRIHNGTTVNATKYNFYKVVDDELENIFNYYARELTAMDTFLIRNAKFIRKSKGRRFVDMGVYHKKSDSDDTDLVGSVKFLISDDKKRFVKIDEQLYDKSFDIEDLTRGSDVK